MFSKFKPTWMVEAIYQITPDQLNKLGIKAVLTDLDNTLIAWNNPDGTQELLDWLFVMQEAKIPVFVVSNNKDNRIKRVVEKLDLPYVARAWKPSTKGMNEALRQLNLKSNEVVMIGDQIMTDIRGANAAHIRSVLVQPIVKTDGWNTRINRFFERKIMKKLMNENPDMRWGDKIK